MRYLRTETLSTEALESYPGNARTHDDEALIESAKTNGQYRSIVARSMGDGQYQILAGHGTVLAFESVGTDMVRVEVIEADDTEARRIVLADNATSRDAGYDDALLLALLDQASTDGGLLGTGWDAAAYKELLDAAGNPFDWQPEDGEDPDEHDVEPPVEAVTRLGDVYELGAHRLVCGDSTDEVVWRRLVGDQLMDCVWTDPPYGVAYTGGRQAVGDGASGVRTPIQNDALSPEALSNLLSMSLGQALSACKPGAAWYVTGSPIPAVSLTFAQALTALQVWRQTVVWVKDSFVFSPADYHGRYENIYYGWKPGGPHHLLKDRTQDTVWEIARPRRSPEHPTMKPVELVTRAIVNSTNPGAIVADPFGGSGTTLIAAEMTGRVARIIELDPRYCDVIVRRWAQVTGATPVRNGVLDDTLTYEPA